MSIQRAHLVGNSYGDDDDNDDDDADDHNHNDCVVCRGDGGNILGVVGSR